MWDPKRLYEDSTPRVELVEAPRPIEERPVCHELERKRAVRAAKSAPRKYPREVMLAQLGFASYVVYINSSFWRGIRSRIITRAAGACEFCHEVPPVVVHHLRYDWETLNGRDDSALAAVCIPCHNAWHRARRRGNGKKRRRKGRWQWKRSRDRRQAPDNTVREMTIEEAGRILEKYHL